MFIYTIVLIVDGLVVVEVKNKNKQTHTKHINRTQKTIKTTANETNTHTHNKNIYKKHTQTKQHISQNNKKQNHRNQQQ